MEFFRKTGRMAIGSRLRMLTDQVTADAAEIYQMYDVEIRPKWFPVFFALKDGDQKSVTQIAREIGHTHPSVSQILREMRQAGIVRLRSCKADGRQTLAALSTEGQRMVGLIDLQYADVSRAIDELSAESGHDLWAAIEDWERLLAARSLRQRVADIKERREETEVAIVPYDDTLHREAFRLLNEEWIRRLFGVVEEADHRELDNPVESILRRGGYIFIALLRGEPVGSFALMRWQQAPDNTAASPAPGPRRGPYDYELVKFAVSPKAQGHGIGRRLLEACLAQARRTGGYRLFLESNRRCAAAVHLYERYGFRHLPVEHSDYARCDVQMELELQ